MTSRTVETELGEVVYECPDCEERYLERRCPDCNLWCRRLGRGGRCPSCDEIVTVAELT